MRDDDVGCSWPEATTARDGPKNCSDIAAVRIVLIMAPGPFAGEDMLALDVDDIALRERKDT